MVDFGKNEDFIKNYQLLKSSRKMAELYHCDKKTILSHAKKIGYDYSNNQEKKLSKYSVEEIANAYYDLGSTYLVAEKYSCSATAVTNFLNKHNIPLNCSVNKLKYITDEDFINLYNSLGSASKVAEALNCSSTAITNHAHKIGYNHTDSKNYKLTDKDKQEIIKEYENKTSTELAKKYNVSRGMITKVWFDYNKIGKTNNIISTTEIDLTGKTFGKWTVLEKSKKRSANGNIKWLCECECGIKREVDSAALRNGTSLSCGNHSNISKGNAKIAQILLEANILFETEKTFDTCKDQKVLPFDFFVDNSYLIEYDGIQHFDKNTKYDYEYTHSHDLIKSQWCKENNIPLIRIPYTYYNQLQLKDLVLSTTLFLDNYAD